MVRQLNLWSVNSTCGPSTSNKKQIKWLFGLFVKRGNEGMRVKGLKRGARGKVIVLVKNVKIAIFCSPPFLRFFASFQSFDS